MRWTTAISHAENFDPVLSRQNRIDYHDTQRNQADVAEHVRRLKAAEALVLVHPVWNFGFPAILKGYFDRVFLPGVSFDIDPGGNLEFKLRHLRRLASVCTYGGDRWRAILAGDPPRSFVKRVLRSHMARGGSCDYLAHYDMNHSTPERRGAFSGPGTASFRGSGPDRRRVRSRASQCGGHLNAPVPLLCEPHRLWGSQKPQWMRSVLCRSRLPAGSAGLTVLKEPMLPIPNVLSIAGSDPSGGAGIQADLKTFAALGCYGMAAITSLTAQNTRGVSAIHVPPPEFLASQIDSVFEDIEVAAIKIGMLATGDIVRVVSDRLVRRPDVPVVLDPVLVATSGDSLGAPDVVDAMRLHLLPLATVITPNLPEAARLAERPVPETRSGLEALAERLHAIGARTVLLKGGHLAGPTATDILFDGTRHHAFVAPRVPTDNTHGTGCTLSSAIAAYLSLGRTLVESVGAAKIYLTRALETSERLRVGGGHGPVHHFHALWRDTGALQ